MQLFQLANPDLVGSDDAFLAKYQKHSGVSSIKEMSIKNQLTKEQHLNSPYFVKNTK